MKNLIQNIKRNYKWALIVLGAGIFIGWIFFRSPGSSAGVQQQAETIREDHDHEGEQSTVWTCSMHPQIRQDQPGQCPICAMDLVPLAELSGDEDHVDPDEIRMTESAAQLANIQTLTVSRGNAHREIFLQGKVKADERRMAELTARFGGRIEKLFVSFTGENVRKGQKLATIYSPELVTAQRELLEAASYKDERPSLYNAARSKLSLWDLTEEQIHQIEQDGNPRLYFDIMSPISGTVTKRHVTLGDYVKTGTELFEVVDLTHVWIIMDAYESDIPWIKVGDPVTYTLESVPGRTYEGKVTYIDPFIDPVTRVVRVRVEQNNRDLSLKPEMFVTATIESDITGGSNALLIPKSAILWTGKRSVVYVRVPDRDQPSFLYREISLGPESGNHYVIEDGLAEGEEIVVNGVFKIDAASQLAGKPSMMNPSGGMVSTGHDHGAMTSGATGGESVADEMEMRPESGEESPAVAEEFMVQLQAVYNAYVPMKNAFVESDPDAVQREAGKVTDALDNVNMALLEGDAHMQWMEYMEVLKSSINSISGSDDIEVQRKSLAGFNDTLYGAVKAFGLTEGKVFYQYCPMALDNKGAHWLSETEDIENPYFGEAMLSCGETQETLEF